MPFRVGLVLLALSIALVLGLFTTPLEQYLFGPLGWYLVAGGLQILSAISFMLAWRARGDALGLAALTLAVIAVLLLVGLSYVFFEITALSGLR